MDKREELPCPFCGSTRLESGGDDKFVGTRCLNCEATGPNHYGKFEWGSRAHAQCTPTWDAVAEQVPLGFECRSCGGSAYNWIKKMARFGKTGEPCCANFRSWVEKASACTSTERGGVA